MSDSVRPHRRQPTRLPCPWDSPGKNTGVGCHFLLDSPKYTEAQNQLAKAEGAIKTEKGWWELPSGQLWVPEELAPILVSQTHQATHLGHDKLEELIRKYFLVPCLSSLYRTNSQNCIA